MFEIPDDDEHLFDDIPLDDITNKSSTVNVTLSSRPQLRVPESTCHWEENNAKQLCPEYKGRNIECATSPPDQHYRPEGTRLQSPEHREVVQHTTPITTTKQIATIHHNSGSSSGNSSVDDITPKRKRKFPGPAGLLPKLGSGNGTGIQSLCAAERTPQSSTTVQTGGEPGLPLSQASDDVFSDVPWQNLLSDLGDDGVKLMKKFSIGSTLLKAGKKQLYQGKAILLFGVVEFIESHGSEASVTLRDKSGKMQGTVHKDLLKEYEAELQIGTVLVLKQVSIISLSNRNHYLNITPNNLVCMYHSKNNKLTTLKFHGSQESLRSVLMALDKKAAARRSMDTSLASGSVAGSSRQSISGSSTGTPVLPGSLPVTPVLNQQLLDGRGSPYNATPNSRLATPVGVRDVAIVTPGSRPDTPRLFQNNDNSSRQFMGNTRLSSLLQNKNISVTGESVGNSSSTSFSNRIIQSSNGNATAVNLNSASHLTMKSSSDIVSSERQAPSWRFKQTATTQKQDSVMLRKQESANTNSTSTRHYQLTSANATITNSSKVTAGSRQTQWSFKSPKSRISDNSSGSDALNNNQPKCVQNKHQIQPITPAVSANTEDDMWDDDDDLNDEILSQLSDEKI